MVCGMSTSRRIRRKNNRLVNLDHNADFSEVDPVQPGRDGAVPGQVS